MDETTSPFYIQNGLQRVNETLSISPKYDSEELLNLVDAEFQKRYGNGTSVLDVSEGSVAQLLEKSGVELIESAISVGSMTCNQMNLNYSQGSFLDTIASLFRLTRKFKIATRVPCRFWGQNYTVIPSGSMVADGSDHTFTVETTVTISHPASEISSTVPNPPSPYFTEGYVVCTEKGEIDVPANTVTTITTGVLGWESVTNPSAGEIGQDDETDAAFRRRVKSCRYRGTAFVKSVRSRIMSVDGVKNCYVYENGTDNTKFIDSDGNIYEAETRASGNTDPAVMPHSTIIIVDGGDENEIAKAIADTRAVGANLTPLYTLSGTEAAAAHVLVDTTATHQLIADYVRTVNFTDPSYYLIYQIVFNLGEIKPYKVEVTVLKNQFTGSASELTEQVKEAIDDWQNGNSPYVDGLSLGQAVYPYEVSAAVSDAIPGIQVRGVKLFVKDGNNNWVAATNGYVPVEIYKKAHADKSTAMDVVIPGYTN